MIPKLFQSDDPKIDIGGATRLSDERDFGNNLAIRGSVTFNYFPDEWENWQRMDFGVGLVGHPNSRRSRGLF